MKFFGRGPERDVLRKTRAVSEKSGSVLTVVTGKRGVGKTRLVIESLADKPLVYWFVHRSAEAVVVRECAAALRGTIGTFVPECMERFAEVFECAMVAGKTVPFTLVIDGFDDLQAVAGAGVFSCIQDIWDRCKDDSHVNFVACGSHPLQMKRIFGDGRAPLYGRASTILRVEPLRTSELKSILKEFNPDFDNEDLLALYAFTGGVPKYVELFMEACCTTRDAMIGFVADPGSAFLYEGRSLIDSAFGRDCGTYCAILEAISCGCRDTPKMSEYLSGDVAPGQYLANLENVHGFVRKVRPPFSAANCRNVRWEIEDMFLASWFRFVHRNLAAVASGNRELMLEAARRDYPEFSRYALERYFRQKMQESGRFSLVSEWWQVKRNGASNEIAVLALNGMDRTAFAADTKIDKKEFCRKEFESTVALLEATALSGAGFRLCPGPACFSIRDM